MDAHQVSSAHITSRLFHIIGDLPPEAPEMTQVVGHLLVEAGYTLWYWGYKNPYMAEYDAWQRRFPRSPVVSRGEPRKHEFKFG